LGEDCRETYVVKWPDSAQSIANQFNIPVRVIEYNNYCYDSESGIICPLFNDGSVSFWILGRNTILSSLYRLCAFHGTSFNVSRCVGRSLPEPFEETRLGGKSKDAIISVVTVSCLYVMKSVRKLSLVYNVNVYKSEAVGMPRLRALR
jgi:hypothetical protein